MSAPMQITNWAAPPRLTTALKGLALAGGLAFLAALALDPERAWRGWLAAELYLVGLGVGAAFFLALQHVTGAGWSVGFRRVPEAMVATLPFAAAFFVPVIIGAGRLYEWTHADVVAKDAALQAKSAWLSLPFFAIRACVYFGAWIALTRAIVRRSHRQDEDGSLEHVGRSARLSGFFLATGAATFSLAVFDWVMSLDPHWTSTIYGVHHWAGAFLSALAAMTLLVLGLRRRGPLAEVVSREHVHDLGRLLLGFSTFWAYTWFSQYMLVWYSNLPEETRYYAGRTTGAWGTLFVVNLVVSWAVPFLVLLPKPAKRDATTVARTAALILVGRWLDLYLDVCQPALVDGPALGLAELGPLALALAVFGLSFARAFGAAPAVPARDPMLVESLHHHA